jgi:hypothetical protein
MIFRLTKSRFPDYAGTRTMNSDEVLRQRVEDILGDAVERCLRLSRRASCEDSKLIARILLVYSEWFAMHALRLRETPLDPAATRRRYH